MLPHEGEFDEVLGIIIKHQSRASLAVNDEVLLTAWSVGGYVSRKLRSEAWGSKVVSQLSEYIRTRRPDIKGYSRSSIYNMVMFFEEYSRPEFRETYARIMPTAFVQPETGQMPSALRLTTLSNHTEILCRCHDDEERIFYILYAHHERLVKRELRRQIDTGTYSNLLGEKRGMSKGLLSTYPEAPVVFKDQLFLDFLSLPPKHSEARLRKGITEHMKQFILELGGKDFLFVDQEYRLTVGASTYKADLLFFHRGLQALVAIELKRTKFHPRDLGQLEFYLEALDRDVKRTNENPSIGIILCPEADRMVVEYAMNRSMSAAMVAEYKRLLIPQERMQKLLNEYCQLSLPSVGKALEGEK